MLGRTLRRRIALDPYPQPFEYSKFPLHFKLLCLSQGFPLLASSQPFYLSPTRIPDFPHSPHFPHSWHTLLPASALPFLEPCPLPLSILVLLHVLGPPGQCSIVVAAVVILELSLLSVEKQCF